MQSGDMADQQNALPKSIAIRQTILQATPLTPESFAPFGTVIQNPSRNDSGSTGGQSPETRNQGTATVYPQITEHTSSLDQCESQRPGRTVLNLFVCHARQPADTSGTTVAVPVLERHPYTTQSFIPLGVSASEAQSRAYVVVVAPTLPAAVRRYATGRGPPDLDGLQAFFAHGGQGVTYGTGTWHSPMIAIGGTIEFVVLQWDNGVPAESCQEVSIGDASAGLAVTVPDALFQV